jgi:hypothetical protein
MDAENAELMIIGIDIATCHLPLMTSHKPHKPHTGDTTTGDLKKMKKFKPCVNVPPNPAGTMISKRCGYADLRHYGYVDPLSIWVR